MDGWVGGRWWVEVVEGGDGWMDGLVVEEKMNDLIMLIHYNKGTFTNHSLTLANAVISIKLSSI